MPLSRREFLASSAAMLAVPGPADLDLAIVDGHVFASVTAERSNQEAMLGFWPMNIGIRDGRIVSLTRKPLKAKRVIDAKGLYVSPGFIDLINHGPNIENDRLQALDGVTTKLQMEAGVPNVAEWYAQQRGKRLLNYGAAASHIHARTAHFGGWDKAEKAVASDADIAEIGDHVERGLREGGLGVGFGLEYQPGTTRWEVIEMFRIAGRHRAACHVHARYGTLLEEQHNLTAIEELIAASVASGAPLHIVHVPSMALRNTDKALRLIEAVQKRGHDVTCDFYPYTAFSTSIDSEVFAPGWQEKFGISYGDLEWAATHERLTAETFAKYQKQGGSVIAHAIPEDAVRAAVKSPATMVGSDGGLSNGIGHPRATGTFARVLGYYARQERLISMEQAVEKMTLLPARRMEKRVPAFRRKGRILMGCDADLAIFDPNKVADRATFDRPAETSVGMHWVLVGGTPVVAEGKLVEGPMPGQPIRAQG